MILYMVVSLNYCSQNGGNLYRAPYYNRNPSIGIDSNLGQSPYVFMMQDYTFQVPRISLELRAKPLATTCPLCVQLGRMGCC